MSGGNRTAVVTAALLCALLLSASSAAIAAGTTEIDVTPAQTELAPGQTTTVDIVVDADGGVGASELRLALDDPTVAQIADVQIHGDPGFTDVTYADDRAWVDVAYATANTSDTGSVAIVTVTLRGEATGSTELDIRPRADNDAVVSYDEQGSEYDITDVGGGVVVVEQNDDSSTAGDDQSDDTSTGDNDASAVDDDHSGGAETTKSTADGRTETPEQTGTVRTDVERSTDDSGSGAAETPVQSASPFEVDRATSTTTDSIVETAGSGGGLVAAVAGLLAIAVLGLFLRRV